MIATSTNAPFTCTSRKLKLLSPHSSSMGPSQSSSRPSQVSSMLLGGAAATQTSPPWAESQKPSRRQTPRPQMVTGENSSSVSPSQSSSTPLQVKSSGARGGFSSQIGTPFRQTPVAPQAPSPQD